MIYFDTSAFVKLIWDEPESEALQAHLDAHHGGPLVSSALLAVEARRAALRRERAKLVHADLLLERVGQVEIGPAVIESAGRYPEPMLRSLDAIHLATAMLVRDEIDALITYDQRFADVAKAEGIPVVAPA